MRFDLTALCAGVQAGEESALEDLYKLVRQLCWYWTLKQLGVDRRFAGAQDCIHDTYILVLEAIKDGHVRQPEALAGYIKTINSRRIAAIVDDRMLGRGIVDVDEMEGTPTQFRNALKAIFNYQEPEAEYRHAEKLTILKKSLAALRPRQREILTRFYLQEQKPDQICREMNLTETQFRLLKSRSKGSLEVIGEKTLAGKNRKALQAKIAA